MATNKCPNCPIVEVCIQSVTSNTCPLDESAQPTTNNTTIKKEKD